MLGADDPLGRVGAGGERGQVTRHAAVRVTIVVVLASPPLDPRIEHVQCHQTAEVKAAVDFEQVAGGIRADRHPLVISAGRIGLADVPVALCGGVMVLGAGHICVVREFMIIPDRD